MPSHDSLLKHRMPIELRGCRHEWHKQQRRYDHPGQYSDDNCFRFARGGLHPFLPPLGPDMEQALDVINKGIRRLRRGQLRSLPFVLLLDGRRVEVRTEDDESQRDRAFSSRRDGAFDKHHVVVECVLDRVYAGDQDGCEGSPEGHCHEIVERYPPML